jgi:FlaA1/EpsC-like NDP-sugar epimerase
VGGLLVAKSHVCEPPIFSEPIPACAEHEMARIRAGEKLREVMISENAVRATLEMPDLGVIGPLFYLLSRTHADRGPATVTERFIYPRNTNTEWWNIEQIRTWVAGAKVATA